MHEEVQGVAMNKWVIEELSTVNFSDARLNKRMHKILDRAGSKPGASLPAACKGWDETYGAYRFFRPRDSCGNA